MCLISIQIAILTHDLATLASIANWHDHCTSYICVREDDGDKICLWKYRRHSDKFNAN